MKMIPQDDTYWGFISSLAFKYKNTPHKLQRLTLALSLLRTNDPWIRTVFLLVEYKFTTPNLDVLEFLYAPESFAVRTRRLLSLEAKQARRGRKQYLGSSGLGELELTHNIVSNEHQRSDREETLDFINEEMNSLKASKLHAKLDLSLGPKKMKVPGTRGVVRVVFITGTTQLIKRYLNGKTYQRVDSQKGVGRNQIFQLMQHPTLFEDVPTVEIFASFQKLKHVQPVHFAETTMLEIVIKQHVEDLRQSQGDIFIQTKRGRDLSIMSKLSVETIEFLENVNVYKKFFEKKQVHKRREARRRNKAVNWTSLDAELCTLFFNCTGMFHDQKRVKHHQFHQVANQKRASIGGSDISKLEKCKLMLKLDEENAIEVMTQKLKDHFNQLKEAVYIPYVLSLVAALGDLYLLQQMEDACSSSSLAVDFYVVNGANAGAMNSGLGFRAFILEYTKTLNKEDCLSLRCPVFAAVVHGELETALYIAEKIPWTIQLVEDFHRYVIEYFGNLRAESNVEDHRKYRLEELLKKPVRSFMDHIRELANGEI